MNYSNSQRDGVILYFTALLFGAYFSQNFRCVSTYEPKPYYGNMRILCCEIQGGHFYPGFFAEDYETWKPYAKGNLTFDLIKGWHLDCITEPNLGENIKKMLDFNY